MKNQIAIVYWKDAAIHGFDQTHREEWAERAKLMPGVAVGHIVHETKDRISLAMDRFPNEQFRVVSSYPKSSIQKIVRKTINVQSLK
jgi:hypothetical protein